MPMSINGPTKGTPITKDPITEPSAGASKTSNAPGNGPSPPPGPVSYTHLTLPTKLAV